MSFPELTRAWSYCIVFCYFSQSFLCYTKLIMPIIKFVDEVTLSHKTILLRVDFNVSLNPNHSIADDARIKQSLPTIELLLKNNNKLILIAHLGEPEKRNPGDSLKPIAQSLASYLP